MYVFPYRYANVPDNLVTPEKIPFKEIVCCSVGCKKKLPAREHFLVEGKHTIGGWGLYCCKYLMVLFVLSVASYY